MKYVSMYRGLYVVMGGSSREGAAEFPSLSFSESYRLVFKMVSK